MNEKQISNNKVPVPRYLVAISPSPHSQFLIHRTRKLALEQDASWMAVYIQTKQELSEEDNNNLKANMKLINAMGAELVVSMDNDIATGLIRIAKQNQITQIIIGKPQLKYSRVPFFKPSVITKLISKSDAIGVLIISENVTGQKRSKLLKWTNPVNKINIREYFLVTLLIIVLILINFVLDNYISYLSVGFIFLAAVAIVSTLFKRGPVLFFSASSAILWNFLFITPRNTFYIDHLEDLFMFFMYFITAIIIGNLTTRLRVKEHFLRKREKNLEELYQMSRILNKANSQDEIIQNSLDFLKQILNSGIALFIKEDNNQLSVNYTKGFGLTEEEKKPIEWCFDQGKPAGKNTKEFHSLSNYYTPLLTLIKPIGVLVIQRDSQPEFTIEQENLISALSLQIATAIERSEYIKSQQKIKLAEESEKMYKIILNSVSHELRTPITNISTAANGLQDNDLLKNEEVRNIFLTDIIDGVDRLNRIIDNLISSMRIESEKMAPNFDWYDISDIVNSAQKKLSKLFEKHTFSKHIEKDLPMFKFDFILLEQLLTNLVFNSIMHTHEKSKIDLDIHFRDNILKMIVSDDGSGIPDSEKQNIFNKFYRIKGAKTDRKSVV